MRSLSAERALRSRSRARPSGGRGPTWQRSYRAGSPGSRRWRASSRARSGRASRPRAVRLAGAAAGDAPAAAGPGRRAVRRHHDRRHGAARPVRPPADRRLDPPDPRRRQRACWPRSPPSSAPPSASTIESDAWRTWSNISPFLVRHGLHLDALSEEQRELALGLLRASLSAAGYQTARDVMRLNHTIAELTGGWDELGEWMYWISLFGTPSETEPWGWQIDGHHLIVNCLVLGDQIVMTPLFMGSEPVVAESGTFAGTSVFEDEEERGYALMQALTPEQQDDGAHRHGAARRRGGLGGLRQRPAAVRRHPLRRPVDGPAAAAPGHRRDVRRADPTRPRRGQAGRGAAPPRRHLRSPGSAPATRRARSTTASRARSC